MKTRTLKCAVEMVPRPLWHHNLRRILPPSQWQKLRNATIARSGLQCQTCGVLIEEKRRINCHEEWRYETEETPPAAYLVELRLSCWSCHAIQHWGMTNILVDAGRLTDPNVLPDLIKHFCRVNQVKDEVFHSHLAQAQKEWAYRSSLEPWEVRWGPFTELVDPILDELEEALAEDLEDDRFYLPPRQQPEF